MKIINFKNLKWLWLSMFLMLLDIGSKYWIKTSFYIGEKIFISSYCNYYYSHNSGIAFGLFSNFNASHRWLFIWIIILIIMIFIISLCISVKYIGTYYYVAYSIIIGGALGNLFDRILYGAVIDFIDLHINNWHWPTFNVADMEICTGVIILMLRNYYIICRRKFVL